MNPFAYDWTNYKTNFIDGWIEFPNQMIKDVGAGKQVPILCAKKGTNRGI